MAKFLSELDLVMLGDGTGDARSMWKLARELVYDTDIFWHRRRLPYVRVYRGFLTDLASVPRLPFAWLVAGGVGNAAAVVHDFLYRYGKYDRRTCDAIFHEALRISGVGPIRAWLMWAAVRLFGAAAYVGDAPRDVS